MKARSTFVQNCEAASEILSAIPKSIEKEELEAEIKFNLIRESLS